MKCYNAIGYVIVYYIVSDYVVILCDVKDLHSDAHSIIMIITISTIMIITISTTSMIISTINC